MTVFTLSSKITFGQYGPNNPDGPLTIQQIIEKDPEYLAWAVDKIEWFELDDETEAALDEVTMIWDDSPYPNLDYQEDFW